jgi:hypothetical protein
MDEQPNQPAEPTEDQLRAAYEEQLKRLRVDDLLIQTIVSLINLGARKLDDKDLDQVRQAIEGTRALLPLAEQSLGPDAAQIKSALSQLQLAYAREVGTEGQPPPPPDGQEEPSGPGPAQSSGRLWVPGQ